MTHEDFFEVVGDNNFEVYELKNEIGLETWTNYGVNMHIMIKKYSDLTFTQQFEDYAESFDVDEEIDIHRQDNSYKNNFSIKQSLEDFESYEYHLKFVLNELKIAEEY